MAEARPLRIVHTSDVHLGAYTGSGDGKWAERRTLMEDTFRRVIDLANGVGADALVIAGDFFDNDRVPEETVVFAATEIREVRRADVPAARKPRPDGPGQHLLAARHGGDREAPDHRP